MKTKILINNEEVEITLTPEQVESITAQQKPKQWEPQGGDWCIDEYGSIFEQLSTKSSRLFGTEYKTKIRAECARNIMRVHNRLLQWVVEHDDGFTIDWNNRNQMKYTIECYAQHDDLCLPGDYEIVCENIKATLGAVYMSRQNAEKLSKLLKSGEVVL